MLTSRVAYKTKRKGVIFTAPHSQRTKQSVLLSFTGLIPTMPHAGTTAVLGPAQSPITGTLAVGPTVESAATGAIAAHPCLIVAGILATA